MRSRSPSAFITRRGEIIVQPPSLKFIRNKCDDTCQTESTRPFPWTPECGPMVKGMAEN